MLSTLSDLNYTLFQALNMYAGHYAVLDAIMVFCADMLIFCWPLFLLLVWGRPLGWRKGDMPAVEVGRLQERRAVVLWLAVACGLAYAINLAIEQFVFEPRPFISHHVHQLLQHAADSSFPSDHTAWSFAVVGMLGLSLLPWFTTSGSKQASGQKSRFLGTAAFWLLLGALAIACAIGIARVFVGVHYPGDIVGGAIDGVIAAFVVTYLRRLLRRPTAAVLQAAQRWRLA